MKQKKVCAIVCQVIDRFQKLGVPMSLLRDDVFARKLWIEEKLLVVKNPPGGTHTECYFVERP